MENGKGVLILSFFFPPEIGGVETHLNDLCEYLSSTGRRIWVVTFQPLTSRRTGSYVERIGHLTVYRLPSPVHNMFYRFQSVTWLRFLLLTPLLLLASVVIIAIHRKDIGVIHAHELNTALAAAFDSWVFGIMSVITIHTVQDYISPTSDAHFHRLARRALSHFDSVMTVSDRIGAELNRLLSRPERLHRMTYWIDLSVFSPEEKNKARRKTGLDDRFTVLFVGRFVEEKGVRLLLEASRRLPRDDISIIFAGEGPMEQEIRNAEKERSNVMCTGPLSPPELRSYYSASDIVVIPSIYEEGFGRVAMEAIACGTPVIGSARGGIPEVFDETVGITFEPDAGALAAVLYRLMHSPEEVERMRSNCRHYAEEHFNVSNALAVSYAYSRPR